MPADSPRRRVPRWLVAVSLALLAAAAWWGWTSYGKASAAPRVPPREGRTRQPDGDGLRLGHALGGEDRAGRLADLRPGEGALRRLQQPGEAGAAPRPHRPRDLRDPRAAGGSRPRGGPHRVPAAAERHRRAALAAPAREARLGRCEARARPQGVAGAEGLHLAGGARQGRVRRADRGGDDPHGRGPGEVDRRAGRERVRGGQAARSGARFGAQRARQDPHHRAGRRRRDLAPDRRRADRRGEPQCPDALHDRAGPARDAGRGGDRRVGHRPHSFRPAGLVHRRRVPRSHLPGARDADPQGGAERAERRHLHRGRRHAEPLAHARARHDRQRAHRHRPARQRAQGAQRRAALPPGRRHQRQGRAGAGRRHPGPGAGRATRRPAGNGWSRSSSSTPRSRRAWTRSSRSCATG